MQFIKKTVVILVIFSLVGFGFYQPASAGVLPMKRLADVETFLYGQSQQKPIVKRIEGLENTLYGKSKKGTLIERANNIVDYVLPSVGKPSLVFLVNTLEWSLTNNISQGNIIDRLDQLEQIVYGEAKTGPVVARVSKLADLSLPEGKVPTSKVTLPADTLIRIKTLDKISSQDSQVGQQVRFTVVNDIKIDSKLIIAGGTKGTMKIEKITEAGKMGQDGKINLQFSKLMTIDGSEIAIKLDKKAQEENRSQKLAIGASILGTIILGPIGLIAGYFVEGKEKDVPAGTEMYVQTVNQKETYGLELY